MNDRVNDRVSDRTNDSVNVNPRTPARAAHDAPLHEPTLGELFMELSDDLSHLVRQELTLAKTEIRENVNRGRQGIVLMAVGGIFAFAGLLALVAAAVIVVAGAVDSYWLSAVIVGAVVVVIGLMLFYSGKGKLDNVNLIPDKTIDSLERDAKMAKEKLT